MTLILCTIAFAGCANNSVKDDPLASFHASKPASILVLPVVNKSVDVMAGSSVLTTLPQLLGERGYYVFPVHTVKTLLEMEGLYEAQRVHEQPVETLASLFGADAILYVTVHSWTSKYVLIQTTTEVDLEYIITNRVGEPLYQRRQKLRYTPDSGQSNSLLDQLIVSAISAAVERADPQYIPLTREANARAFITTSNPLPPGPYSLSYEKYYATPKAD
ncbi:DUF799 domain-containing protein [Reinekea marinisedimentorum]|nr:GNA1162 family protein [Reinekea marinisedimentorum]